MAVILPPTPIGVPPGHSFWNDWYEKLRTVVNTGAISVIWSNINFAGSNITSIANRAHNNLQSLQGGAAGEYYHLTAAQYAALGGGGAGTHNSLSSIQGGSATERYHLTSAQYTEATASRSSRGVDTTDDIVIDLATKGLVLKDTQGTPHYWRVTISTTGSLTTTDLGTTKP